MNPDTAFWSGKRVFLTGHTGFKGAWLAVWLHDLGARVRGYALAPDTSPSMFGALRIGRLCDHVRGDIRDADRVAKAVREFRPQVVIHMAAQALVRRAYREPLATFDTNVMGTANVLEACRGVPGLRSIVVVTTDKCYENREWVHPYREVDPLGGHDPYSASKAAAEIVAGAYRRSFFHEGDAALATARAGNVIGGGDWSEDRLLPDAARAFTNKRTLEVRNPAAVRPWQHVLDPLRGYLTLAWALHERGRTVSPAFNFGPPPEQAATVGEVVDAFARHWGRSAKWKHRRIAKAPHEAGLLMLDPSRAGHELDWRPRFSLDESLEATSRWYRSFASGADGAQMLALTREQINEFTSPPIPF